MNELEWHRQMRALREPVAPQRDLWTQIDAALDAAQPTVSAPPARRRHHRVWLLAASFAGLAILAGGVAFHLRQQQVQVGTELANTATPTATTPDLTRWKPTDPRLAGAAIELDAAQLELRQALKQAPDSVALQRLLDRTERQQSQLRRMENQAG
jgi:hypothetical protein